MVGHAAPARNNGRRNLRAGGIRDVKSLRKEYVYALSQHIKRKFTIYAHTSHRVTSA